jgi:hypothetical protein
MRRPASRFRPFGRRRALAALVSVLLASTSSALGAESPDEKPRGRPAISLDRLVFPGDVAGGRELERHLKHTLLREARRADWGAGSSAKIEFRFFVEELSVRAEGNVLRIRCTALGRLPKGKSARSRIEYGGSPARRSQEIKKVLEIVARGVMTRLAEMERHRRLGN